MALTIASCGPARVARPGHLRARVGPPSTSGAERPSCDELGADTPRACVIAVFDAEAGRVVLEVRLDPAALPATRREVEVVFGEARHALGPVGEPTELRHEVTLVSRAAPGESFRHAAGWHLAGRTFLPAIVVDGEPVEVPATLFLDTGALPLATSAGDDHRAFDAPSLTRLADEVYEVGPLARTSREVGADTLLVVGSLSREALGRAADVLAGVYRELAGSLGDSPASAILIVLHPADGAPWAARAGGAIVWALEPAEDPVLALAGALTPLAQHFLRSEEPWVSEGVAAYLALRAGAGLLELSPRAVPRQMIRIAAVPDHAAHRGTLAAFCLDADLTAQGSSLAAALAAARGTISSEGVLGDLAAVWPDAASHLAALLEPGTEIAVDDCLSPLGWRAVEQALAAPTEAALRSALGVETWTEHETLPLLRIDAAGEGGPLEVGDVLLAVGATPVAAPDDVAWALRDLPASARVELSVWRRGARTSRALVVPDLAGVERAERAYVELAQAEEAP